MTRAEDHLVRSRSESSLSISSQSTHYTDYFGDDDITPLIQAQNDGDNNFGDISMETINANGFSQNVEEAGAKRKRVSDEDADGSVRPRKTAHISEAEDIHLGVRDSLATVVGDTAVSPVRRTDTGSTVITSNPNSQKPASKVSCIQTKPLAAGSPRGRFHPTGARPPDSTSSALLVSTEPTPATRQIAPSGPIDCAATNAAVPPVESAPREHEEEEAPVATLVPQAANIPAVDFEAPRPVVVSAFHNGFLTPLPWGVQWEIHRYICTGLDYGRFSVQFLKKLRTLNKNVTAAPEVTKFVERERNAKRSSDADVSGEDSSASDEFAEAYSREQSARLPWDELDQEDEILCDHEFGALGCNEHEEYNRSDPDWYGGKVHFTARVLSKEGKDGGFRFVLERPALGSSNRFMRRFGSRRFVRVQVQKNALCQKGSNLTEYFRRPFIIGNAVFRAFFAKEQNVFLVRTNEVVHGWGEDIRVTAPDPGAASSEMSFMWFVNWHNDLLLNSDQTMSKWAARFALGLSNSVPGLRLKPENVKFVNDIICDAFDGNGKPPSEMQMTDGCGFANRAVMRLLHEKFRVWQEEPTAIQCRIGGAKGLLLVRRDLTDDEEVEPTIWLRPSQTKIKYSSLPLDQCILPEDTDPGKLTLDVLRTSRMKTPARLSVETITNFAENSVPFKCFSKLFQENLTERIDILLDWKSNNADPNGVKLDTSMKLLWHALAREGGVIAARMARVDSGRARLAGLVADDQEEEIEDEDGLSQLDKALHEQSSAWWDDPVSGSPSGLEETCMSLIDSGFRPDTCAVLGEKLREVAKKAVKTFQSKFRFEVPMSCSAFIVPDPFGVLKPNEIHVLSSRQNLVDHKGKLTDLVQGEVLVTRHPCKVPSDVQKVKAVFHERLRYYRDVIVVSTESHTYEGQSLYRHLASLTGGGDYDGDIMEVFWDPAIVGAFKSPDPSQYAVEPKGVKDCLHKNSDSVKEYLAQHSSTASEEFKIYSLQKYLLGALQDKKLVGQYSTWWEMSTYCKGYKHDETIFLAYMFCAVLDGSKTGVTVIQSEYEKHCELWGACGRALRWKQSEEEREEDEKKFGRRIYLNRKETLPKFIMQELRELIDETCKKQTNRIMTALPKRHAKKDDALVRPWEDAWARAQALAERGISLMKEELEEIKAHVVAMFVKNAEAMSAKAHKNTSFTSLAIEKRQDILRELSREFHSKPANLLLLDAVSARRIKASYAYLYDYEHAPKRWSRFPWNVATRALCEIKAEALGFPKTIAAEFYPWMVMSSAYIRKHSQK